MMIAAAWDCGVRVEEVMWKKPCCLPWLVQGRNGLIDLWREGPKKRCSRFLWICWLIGCMAIHRDSSGLGSSWCGGPPLWCFGRGPSARHRIDRFKMIRCDDFPWIPVNTCESFVIFVITKPGTAAIFAQHLRADAGDQAEKTSHADSDFKEVQYLRSPISSSFALVTGAVKGSDVPIRCREAMTPKSSIWSCSFVSKKSVLGCNVRWQSSRCVFGPSLILRLTHLNIWILIV